LKGVDELPANFETDELNQDLKMAILAYQKKNNLPCGNLNIATIDLLGVKY
jgi:hypothetical protein